MIEQLALIGCGLMGGSFALALKRAGLVRRVVGYSRSPASTARALELGVIDAPATTAAQAATGSDVVLLAVPVAATEATLRSIRDVLEPGMLVMDVGSTKQDVVAAARLGLGESHLAAFVPCHPIAGKESAGIDHADAALYQDRLTVLAPIEATGPAQLERAHALWRAIGCRVEHMTPAAHDAAFAAVSHLPHVLAFAFINGLQAQPAGADYLRMGGPGFRDFTRIAASDPQVWRDILVANREEVLAQSRHFRRSLEAFEQAVQAGDGASLEALIQQASAVRARWRLGHK